ncbi:MAG: hypothetical protein AAF698_05455, partial [Pseudomonadota bacterium]
MRKAVPVRAGHGDPDKIAITNCHIHTFTIDHLPQGYYRFFGINPMKLLRQPWIRAPVIWLGERKFLSERLNRAMRFARIAANATQADVFKTVREYYPGNTRFVILPMDMALMGWGEPRVPIQTQHDQLHALAQ